MKQLAARRQRNALSLFVAIVVVLVLAHLATSALRDTARLSGWGLFLLVVFLALYNVRKKLPFLTLGSSVFWLQMHIYVGLFSGAVFAIHIAWSIPNGALEIVLALLYVCTFLSGILGLFLSRTFARRLTTRGGEIIYERVGIYRRRLAGEVEQVVLQCLEETESTTIAQFYSNRLQPFFESTRHFWHHVLQSERPRRTLLSEIKAHHRYLNDAETKTMREITACVERKDDLDYQYALQSVLKYWLFIHVPLTYALLVFAVVHLLLVSAFGGAL